MQRMVVYTEFVRIAPVFAIHIGRAMPATEIFFPTIRAHILETIPV